LACTADFIANGRQLFHPTSFFSSAWVAPALEQIASNELGSVRADDEPVGAAVLTGLGLSLLPGL
jgi:hypothetical protein